MPLDEPTAVPAAAEAPAAEWPELDQGLLGRGRPAVPPFPLSLLPTPWRAWVEEEAPSSLPPEYFALALLGAAASMLGNSVRMHVAGTWREPLILWPALVGGPSSGRTRALAKGRLAVELASTVVGARRTEDQAGLDLRVSTLGDTTAKYVTRELETSRRGVSLWREELANWILAAASDEWRPAWIGAWGAGDVTVHPARQIWPTRVERFAVGICGALDQERLTDIVRESTEPLVARFLYAWPEPPGHAPLVAGPSSFDHVAFNAMMMRLMTFSVHGSTPRTLPFVPDAVARLDALLPAVRALRHDADGAEAAWLGKGPSSIARLAGVLRMMHWASRAGAESDPAVRAEDVDAAHSLWSDYLLPHARAVFGAAGTTETDRLARRAARWLRRQRKDCVSRREVRRHALGQAVDLEGVDDVLAQLESAGALRAIPGPDKARRGRPSERWAINPALR
ncbi:MAG: DUF3987 domain-containing protein [Enhydrobacter sp.]|nr:MAG: DUF3987 domain-containing protein [Enhydrobacter sp.]